MTVLTYPVDIKNIGALERGASLAAGAGLIVYGVKKRSVGAVFLALLGGDLVYRGASGYSVLYHLLGRGPFEPERSKAASIDYRQGIRVDKSIIIDKPPEELYGFWRKLENLPKFMQHLRDVVQINDRVSHWIAEGPVGTTVEWDAEINSEEPNQRIGWRSLSGSEIETAGSVHFLPAPDGRGTEVSIELQYKPPAGAIGAVAAKLLGADPAVQVAEDLRLLKQILEGHTQTDGETTPRGNR